MTPSALYRYFGSRDTLLNDLMVDGFSSLADALVAAAQGVAGQPCSERFLVVVRAYRRWAIEHPTAYALIFGVPVPGFEAEHSRLVVELHRGVAVLFEVMIDRVAAGELDVTGFDQELNPVLRGQFEQWQAKLGIDLPPAALAGCLVVWSQLHGALSLELFGHLPPPFRPADELFEQQMRHLLVLLHHPRSEPPPAGGPTPGG